MYEHRHHPLLTTMSFVKRVLHHLSIAMVVGAVGLGIGVVGYHVLGGLNWVDSLLNASMILGGMGPVDPLPTPVAKVFAACYALFSGLVFIGVATLIVTPFAHRVLHRFHMGDEE